MKNIKVFIKKKKKKSENMAMNDTKIYQKMKNNGLLSTEKNIIKSEKNLIIIIRNFYFKN